MRLMLKCRLNFFDIANLRKGTQTLCSLQFFNLIQFSQLLWAEVEAEVCIYAVMRQVCQLLPCLEIIWSSSILESAHLLVRCVYVCEPEPIKMWESASICGDTNRNNVWSHLKCDTLRQNLWIGLQAVSECWEAPAARQHSYNSDRNIGDAVQTVIKSTWTPRMIRTF